MWLRRLQRRSLTSTRVAGGVFQHDPAPMWEDGGQARGRLAARRAISLKGGLAVFQGVYATQLHQDPRDDQIPRRPDLDPHRHGIPINMAHHLCRVAWHRKESEAKPVGNYVGHSSQYGLLMATIFRSGRLQVNITLP